VGVNGYGVIKRTSEKEDRNPPKLNLLLRAQWEARTRDLQSLFVSLTCDQLAKT
jgi:hypothetical protein